MPEGKHVRGVGPKDQPNTNTSNSKLKRPAATASARRKWRRERC